MNENIEISKEVALKKIAKAIEENEQLMDKIRQLDAGKGTYSEVDDIATFIGEEIAKQLTPYYSAELLEAYEISGHELIVLLAEAAQKNLNAAAKIGMKPMTTKYPKAKVAKVAAALEEVSEEALPKKIQTVLPSLALEMVDDIVRYNADFQAKAGLRPIIVRTWSGQRPSHDTKHTDWCEELAGTYDYGKEPKEVYARHEGCRCKVEYFPNRLAKGRITALAKGEVDTKGVLWNTKAETLEKRLKKAGAQ